MKQLSMMCLIDESGSLLESDKEPFRVGFLLTCHPNRLEMDIRKLKRELPPVDKCGEYHARKDLSITRSIIRGLLCLNVEPRMYIVEWIKKEFSKQFFINGKLQVCQDTNTMIASFSIFASQIAAIASAKGFAIIHIIAEGVKPDIQSEHRSREQAFSTVLRTALKNQAVMKIARSETQSIIKISTKRKREYPPLSFVDYWLWAYSRFADMGDKDVLPVELQKRTIVERMTEKRLGRS